MGVFVDGLKQVCILFLESEIDTSANLQLFHSDSGFGECPSSDFGYILKLKIPMICWHLIRHSRLPSTQKYFHHCDTIAVWYTLFRATSMAREPSFCPNYVCAYSFQENQAFSVSDVSLLFFIGAQNAIHTCRCPPQGSDFSLPRTRLWSDALGTHPPASCGPDRTI